MKFNEQLLEFPQAFPEHLANISRTCPDMMLASREIVRICPNISWIFPKMPKIHLDVHRHFQDCSLTFPCFCYCVAMFLLCVAMRLLCFCYALLCFWYMLLCFGHVLLCFGCVFNEFCCVMLCLLCFSSLKRFSWTGHWRATGQIFPKIWKSYQNITNT